MSNGEAKQEEQVDVPNPNANGSYSRDDYGKAFNELNAYVKTNVDDLKDDSKKQNTSK